MALCEPDDLETKATAPEKYGQRRLLLGRLTWGQVYLVQELVDEHPEVLSMAVENERPSKSRSKKPPLMDGVGLYRIRLEVSDVTVGQFIRYKVEQLHHNREEIERVSGV